MRSRAIMHLTLTLAYGRRKRKKLGGLVVLTGMAMEKAPVGSNCPLVLTVQLANGACRLVLVNQV